MSANSPGLEHKCKCVCVCVKCQLQTKPLLFDLLGQRIIFLLSDSTVAVWKFAAWRTNNKFRVQNLKPMVIFKCVHIFSLGVWQQIWMFLMLNKLLKPVFSLPSQKRCSVLKATWWEEACFYVSVSVRSLPALEFPIGAKAEPPWAVFHVVCSWRPNSEQHRHDMLFGVCPVCLPLIMLRLCQPMSTDREAKRHKGRTLK